MADFTEVTNQGWFSRIGGSIKSVLFGLLLFVAAFPLLWWNEGRAVKTAKSLKEGAAAVVQVKPDAVSTSNDGKLIHFSAEATTSEVLTDPEFAVSATAIKLERTAEMYQWDEDEHTETKKKTGGGTTKTTTYSYDKTWSTRLISSSDFAQQEGHQNPVTMPYQSREVSASTVTAGAFTLSGGLVGQINTWESLSAQNLPPNAPPGLLLNSGGFYIGGNPAIPVIGDVRIRFRQVPPAIVSIIAQQQGSNLNPYQTKAGRALEMLEIGMHSADEMFKAAVARNKSLTWILRAVGCFVMFLGLTMIFKPLVVVADVLPILGNILGAGVGLFSFVIAATLSLITIGLAWIAYRPLLGIALLAVAAGVVFLGRSIAKKKGPKLPPIPT